MEQLSLCTHYILCICEYLWVHTRTTVSNYLIVLLAQMSEQILKELVPSITSKVRNSVRDCVKDAVKEAVKTQLPSAFRESFEGALLPAFEAGA